MTLREALTQAVLARFAAYPGLPTPTRDDVDPKAESYVAVGDPQFGAAHFLSLIDEGVVARDGCPPVMGAGGVVYDWTLTLTAAYAVRCVDAGARRFLTDGFVAAAATLTDSADAASASLGGLAVWSWVMPVERDDDLYDGAVAVNVRRVPLQIWFQAANPAA